MKQPLKIGLTVALEAPAGSPFPIVRANPYETVDWMCKKGFDSIEMHLRTPTLIDGHKFKDYCLTKNMEISTIGTGQAYGCEGLSLTSRDSAIRKAAINRLKNQMDLGKIFECSVIIGSMRGIIESWDTFSAVEARMVESCKILADYAEKQEVNLVIEAIDRFETNYLRTAQDVLQIIDLIGSPRFLVHLDTFHMNLEEQDWIKPILDCGTRLGHVHVADNSRNYPGWGLIDFKPILAALEQIGYSNSLTIECFPVPDGFTAAERGLNYLRSLTMES